MTMGNLRRGALGIPDASSVEKETGSKAPDLDYCYLDVTGNGVEVFAVPVYLPAHVWIGYEVWIDLFKRQKGRVMYAEEMGNSQNFMIHLSNNVFG